MKHDAVCPNRRVRSRTAAVDAPAFPVLPRCHSITVPIIGALDPRRQCYFKIWTGKDVWLSEHPADGILGVVRAHGSGLDRVRQMPPELRRVALN